MGETEITAMSELGITATPGPDQGTAYQRKWYDRLESRYWGYAKVNKNVHVIIISCNADAI